MNFKNNLLPAQLDFYLKNYKVLVKCILPGNLFQLKLYKPSDGEFGFDEEVCIEFEGTKEHFEVLEKNSVQI